MSNIDAISSNNPGVVSQNHVEEIKSLDQTMSESKTDLNLGFLMMYEEWKQSILLSDGINEDENAEW
ncbi:hypothetical protein ACLEUK_19945 [Pseudescherichia vulneris]